MIRPNNPLGGGVSVVVELKIAHPCDGQGHSRSSKFLFDLTQVHFVVSSTDRYWPAPCGRVYPTRGPRYIERKKLLLYSDSVPSFLPSGLGSPVSPLNRAILSIWLRQSR